MLINSFHLKFTIRGCYYLFNPTILGFHDSKPKLWIIEYSNI